MYQESRCVLAAPRNNLLTSLGGTEYNCGMYQVRGEWGHRLRDLRGERNQVEMAAMTGVSQATWSKLERGLFEVSDTLKVQIAQRAGVRVGDLWAWPEGVDGL